MGGAGSVALRTVPVTAPRAAWFHFTAVRDDSPFPESDLFPRVGDVGFYQRQDRAVTSETTANVIAGKLRPGNVVFTARDPYALSAFWAQLTGYEPRPLFGQFVGLRDPTGRGPHLTFQRGDEVADLPGRCHVDFYADDPDDVAERALQLGAGFVRRVNEGGVAWVVLTDPEGNEFCVVAAVGNDRRP